MSGEAGLKTAPPRRRLIVVAWAICGLTATLAGELRGVVADTMQPAHVSQWLRRTLR